MPISKIERAGMPGGAVLQVVQTSYSTQGSSSTNTFVDTGVSATITPSSSTNKILVLLTMQGVGKDGSAGSVDLRLVKDGLALTQFAVSNTAYTASTGANYPGTAAFNYLDSPASISALNYKVQFRANNNAAGAYVQANGSVSTITLMEIAA